MGTEPARWAHVSPASGPKNRLPRWNQRAQRFEDRVVRFLSPKPRYTDPLLAEIRTTSACLLEYVNERSLARCLPLR